MENALIKILICFVEDNVWYNVICRRQTPKQVLRAGRKKLKNSLSVEYYNFVLRKTFTRLLQSKAKKI